MANKPRKSNTPATTSDNRPATGRGGKYNFPTTMKALENDEDKRAFMAKCVENNLAFFSKGVQTKVRNDDELCERLNWFFTTCAETQQLPTVEKMANALGYHRQTLFEWETGANGGFSPATGDIIRQAKQVLAGIDAELAQEGKIQPVVYLFRSKNFYGMKDQQDVVVTPNAGNITPTDIKTIEAKYAELPED